MPCKVTSITMSSLMEELQNYKPSPSFIVVTSLVVLVVTVIAIHFVVQRKRLPPGPVAWPVVGSFPAIAGALPHRALHKLAAEFGGLMFLRLGSVPTMVVSTAAIAEELFKNHDGNFLGRPRPMPMGLDTVTDQGKNILMANDLYWRQLRKICISELFTPKRQASHQGMRTDEIRLSMKEIITDSEQQKPINLKAWLQGVTANIMIRMTTNKRFFGKGVENKRDKEDFELVVFQVFDILGTFIISDYVPYLRFVSKLQGWDRRFENLRTEMADINERVFEIEKHRQRAKERSALDDEHYIPDFVDVLLQTTLKDGQILPDRNISLILGDMLGGGSDTSATTVEWGLAELVLQPHLMRRVQLEIDAVVGATRVVQESDIPNLPFLQAVVKETFRLHPPGPLPIPREASQAFEFRGYKFPKQTNLILNLFSIHRDPSVYDKPDEFRPDRFVERPEVDHLSGFDSYELAPFSMGRRMCPAFNLGNTMVTSLLAHLVHSFDWSMPIEGETPDMTELYGLTVGMKSPLLLRATHRAPAFLY